jgi:hypothetical protein
MNLVTDTAKIVVATVVLTTVVSKTGELVINKTFTKLTNRREARRVAAALAAANENI